jgi:hypothetical protein
VSCRSARSSGVISSNESRLQPVTTATVLLESRCRSLVEIHSFPETRFKFDGPLSDARGTSPGDARSDRASCPS